MLNKVRKIFILIMLIASIFIGIGYASSRYKFFPAKIRDIKVLCGTERTNCAQMVLL